jgi:hypothetical protein
MPQWFRPFGAPFEDPVAQGHSGVASLIELTQQPVRFVDVRLEPGEIEAGHLIAPAEPLSPFFGPPQEVPRVLQLLACRAEIALIQIRTGADQGGLRFEKIVSQLGRVQRPVQV